jgi:hypothetical protein
LLPRGKLDIFKSGDYYFFQRDNLSKNV